MVGDPTTLGSAPFLPRAREDLTRLLDFYLLARAIDHLGERARERQIDEVRFALTTLLDPLDPP